MGSGQGLIGTPGSRQRLATPALVLDLDAFEANLAAMARHAEARGVALRPHAKAHKSLTIARKQMAAGAVGVCCATVGEAEVMADGGIAGVLVTSPVTAPGKIARLAALNARAEGLMVVADDVEVVGLLAGAAAATGKPLTVLVDVDVGQRRTGAADAGAALGVARRIAESNALSFGGVQAYAGHIQHIAAFEERQAAAERAMAKARAAVESIRDAGFEVARVSGAGTGTHAIDAGAGLFTELQAGSYLFMDAQYGAVALARGARPFRHALFVQTTVVSANIAGQATTDGGLKAFSTEGPAPVIAKGAPKGAVYRFTGDEFGCIAFDPALGALAPGAVVECVVPHCDPTVNLYDAYHCVQGEVLVDVWPIEARGRY